MILLPIGFAFALWVPDFQMFPAGASCYTYVYVVVPGWLLYVSCMGFLL